MDARAKLRRFGLLVGGAFLVLGGISRWRGHQVPPYILAAIGLFLVLGGLLAPGALAPVERKWLAFGALLHRINSTILLVVIFFAVMVPVGLVMRLFRDPMRRRPDPASSLWVKVAPAALDAKRYRQPF